MNLLKKIKFNPLKFFALHALGWSLLFILNFLFAKNYSLQFDFPFHLVSWSIYLLIFYLNFSLFMPFLLYRKKVLPYLLASLFLIAGSFLLKDKILFNHPERIGLAPPDFISKEPDRRPDMNPERRPEMRPDRRPGEIPSHLPRKGRPFFFTYDLLLFYTASFSLRFIQKWRDDEKHKSDLEKEKISTELSFLKQQINPHFLFNSLNSIYSLSLSKSEIATSSILKLSSILRYVLYESENSMVNLKDELKIINDYIELQKLRLTEKVALTYKIIGEPGQYKIEPFILVPLIENAFKYGVDNVNNSFIDIIIIIIQQRLDVTIKNKIVYHPYKGKQDSGIGIKNIRRRLELLYPDGYIFHTDESGNVFSVHLELKLKK